MNAAVLIEASIWPKIVVENSLIAKLSIFVRLKAKTKLFPNVTYWSIFFIKSPKTEVIFDMDLCFTKKFDSAI